MMNEPQQNSYVKDWFKQEDRKYLFDCLLKYFYKKSNV